MMHTENTRLTQAISYVDARMPLTPLNGKVATELGWPNTKPISKEELPEFFVRCGDRNFGVVLGELDLVLDFDPRNSPLGKKLVKKFLDDVGITTEELFATASVVYTGGGGLHVYYKLPRPLEIRKRLPDYKGVDALSKNKYVVGAGGTHPLTGEVYRWEKRSRPFSERGICPDSILALVTKAPSQVSKEKELKGEDTNDPKYDDSEEAVARYTEYLLTTPVAVRGEQGDEHTYAVACVGKDFGLTEGKTYELIEEYFNPRCDPPWDDLRRLRSKVANAYEYSKKKYPAALYPKISSHQSPHQ